MANVVLIGVVCLFLLWGIGRLTAFVIVWLGKKYTGVEVKIGRVGVLTFSQVQIIVQKSIYIKVEIGKIWITSCYFNKATKKVLGLCVSDVRIQVDLPPVQHDGGLHLTPTKRNNSKPGNIARVVRLLSWLSLSMDNARLTARGGRLHSSILHVTVDEAGPDIVLTKDSAHLEVQLQQLHAKILNSAMQPEEEKGPCMADLVLTVRLAVDTAMQSPLLIQNVKVDFAKPMMRISDECIRTISMSQNGTAEKCPEHSGRQAGDEQTVQGGGALPIRFSIQRMDFDLAEGEIILVQETQKQEVKASVKKVSVRAEYSGTDQAAVSTGRLDINIHGAHVKSLCANLLDLRAVLLEVQVSEEIADVSLQILHSFVGFHQEELQQWWSVVEDLTPRTRHTATNPSPPRLGILQGLEGRKVKARCHVKNLSTAVATSGCGGLKGGMMEGRVVVEATATNQGVCGDLDLTVASVYCKLAEGSVPASELSPTVHHWNVPLYLHKLAMKIESTEGQVSVHGTIDDVQVELSTPCLAVISALVGRARLASAKPPTPPVAIETRRSQCPRGAGILRDRQLRVTAHCANAAVFISYDHIACVMVRVDSWRLEHRHVSSEVSAHGTKAVYITHFTKGVPLVTSAQLHDFNAHMICVKANYSEAQKRLRVVLPDEVYILWSMGLHQCLLSTWRHVQKFATPLGIGRSDAAPACQNPRADAVMDISIHSSAKTTVTLQLAGPHRVTVSTPSLTIERLNRQFSLDMEQLSVTFDHQEIFNIQGIRLRSDHHSENLGIERLSLGKLTLPTNRAWLVHFDNFNLVFPYNYNFAQCFEEVKNLNKWRKLVHGVVKPPFTVDSPLPADIIIKAKKFSVQVCDDPFEVKLGDNYKLLCDEYCENERRRATLDKRVQELKKSHGLLPAGKVDEMYAALSRKAAQLYIQRSRQLYNSSRMRSKLFTWSVDDLEFMAFADRSLHGKNNVLGHMRDMDSDSSAFLGEDMEFVTLFCRLVHVSLSSWTLQLRDFPLPLLAIRNLSVWGRLVGAEQRGAPRAQRSCQIEVGQPWDAVTVTRNMPALKFYHDFSSEIGSFDLAYGACWEPAFAQFNQSMNLINRPSVDPSRPMPFWDKFRLLLHGRLTMSVDKMSWVYHCSLDPYNVTEMMDWTWTHLLLDWTNAKWVLRGDLDIYARTASKYDDCRLLHLPNLRFCIRLDWVTLGDHNDHHSVMPCAPDKVPEFSMEEHDSFRAFRSQSCTTQVSFETWPLEGTTPACLFYASTLRWMDKIKMCMARVSCPIKRGKLFGVMAPRKPQLSRHMKNLRFSFALHEFQVCYWASFARQNGAEGQGGSLNISVGLQLSMCHLDDGLARRPRAVWSMREFNGQINDVTVWLCSARDDKKKGMPLRSPAVNRYFLSVERVSYERVDETQQDSTILADPEEAEPTHHVQVENLKGAWTPSNRDVAFSLYDGYVKAKTLKKNVSADALQGVKVDTSQSPQKPPKPRSLSSGALCLSLPNSPSPLTKLQTGPAYSMLQKLVSETDTKFVAANEEGTDAAVRVEQLAGIAACQIRDVQRKNWHVELYNSQVVLRGTETAGYVIVSAAKASLLTCDHHPIWQKQQLRSKMSLVGSVEGMQYYATVSQVSEDDLVWLSREDIEKREVPPHLSDVTPTPGGPDGIIGMAHMLGSGQQVGGVVSDTIEASHTSTGAAVQLQRIISRCHCQMFYAGYGEVEDTITEVPLPLTEGDSDMMKPEEGIDSFTLLHHDLNICTNSLQYTMIIDIINNLLLYVEPHRKELTEKLQHMKFTLQLASVEDQKTPILQRQNSLRELVQKIRRIEREIYMLQRNPEDQPMGDDVFQAQSQELEKKLEVYKEQVNSMSEELAIMVSCLKDCQLQVAAQHRAVPAAMEGCVLRRYEVYFKYAEWRMTEADGQIGIADLVLKHFLYTKTNREDDSGSHQFELGWIKAANLLSETPYKDLVCPQDIQGKGFTERETTLRILCKFKAPVGGISVKEHFEVNVAPLAIQMTARFYAAAMAFFFNQRHEDLDDEEDVLDELEQQQSLGVAPKSKRKEDKPPERSGSRRHGRASANSNVDDIDKMKQRAAKNNMFHYIKIPEVPLRVSYKGQKEKNIKNIHDFYFLLPTLEYHNQTWTWQDLALAVKNDSKKVLISQAVKQKLHMSTKSILGNFLPEEVVQGEEDKARLLLGGGKLFGSGERATSKKNLFGNKTPK